jgi:transcriptional regulator with XRE-family HTH domain
MPNAAPQSPISLSQIKAARALLGWTQETLAQAAGLSLPSINNLERGLYSPRPETLAAIVVAFESAGIEFTPQNGLRQRQADHDCLTLTGPTFIRDLDRDILDCLKEPTDEIIGVTCDDRKWMDFAGYTNPIYVDAREKIRWRERFLIADDATFITSPPAAYRTLPKTFFGAMNYEIYANRLALIEWEAMRVTLIKNAQIADLFRRPFDLLWQQAKPFSPKQLKKIERLDQKRRE